MKESFKCHQRERSRRGTTEIIEDTKNMSNFPEIVYIQAKII